MSETKHTPGSWFTYDTGNGLATNHYLGIGSNCGTRQVAKVEGWGEQATANARLIAAAPELLEALREAIDVLDARGVPHNGHALTEYADCLGCAKERVTSAAIAAIAKATGGAA